MSDRSDDDEPSVEELLRDGTDDAVGDADPLLAGLNEWLPGGLRVPNFAGQLLLFAVVGVVLLVVISGLPAASGPSLGPAQQGVEDVVENAPELDTGASNDYEGVRATVVGGRVADGRPVVLVESEGGVAYEVKLVGVEAVPTNDAATATPTTYGLPDTVETRECIAEAGESARSTLNGLRGEEVTVLVVSEESTSDGGKVVRGYVRSKDESVGLRLLAEGSALPLSNHAYAEAYQSVNEDAASAGVGVYSCE